MTLVGGLVAEFVLPAFVRDRVAVRLLVLSSAGVGWSGSGLCGVLFGVCLVFDSHVCTYYYYHSFRYLRLRIIR